MPRVKRGTVRATKRKRLLKKTKGYHWGRKNLVKAAKIAVKKAGVHAYFGRKQKKRVNRGLWNIQIGAAAKELGLSYSQIIGDLKKRNIELNRKMLADLAANHPEIFKKLVGK